MTYLPPAADRAVAVARPLPSSLIEARAAVFNPLLCLDLNATSRRVLFGILTFLNLRNARKAIFPRRDLLRAEALLNSEATLYRGLKQLVDKGYITREQTRRSFGEFHLSPISLTTKALTMLGLNQVIHRERSLKVRDGYIKKEHTKDEQSFQNTAQPSVRSAVPKPEHAGEVNDIDPSTGLPIELLRLRTLDISKGTICWLMLHAKLAGKRLGDVVAAVWHRISTLRGRSVVAYLRAVMAKPLDFAWIAQQRHEKATRHGALRRASEMLASLGRRHHGLEVLARDGTVCGIFEASDAGTHAVVGRRGSLPVNLSFANALLQGDIAFRSADEMARMSMG
ncbi:hypothetical protein [Noviherbaspirillum pedocola]|uniref:Replication protein O n=1 Tax=Noviherbaspirillum pedocola TaxID=2801341 RepID=A0A934SYW5_9BURK|nr:hypothetical protein [Noviherbaspirillum pedocola]MBK4735209.1 hypothetical protein [Noviherbaspirillum pedocola]